MRFLFAFLTPLHRTYAPNFTLQHSNLVPFRPYSCIFFYSLSRKRLASPVLSPQNTSSKCHFQVFQELITSNGSALSIHYPKIPPNTFAAPFKSCAETSPNLEDVFHHGGIRLPIWRTFLSMDGFVPHFGRCFYPWMESCPTLEDVSIHIKTAQTTLLHQKKAVQNRYSLPNGQFSIKK